jgi:glycosyltransferase involved in cell wall biosynthesis
LGWTDEHQVIGYVGRLAHLKGADLLATAFHESARTMPRARLLIVGSGEEEGKLRSILAEEIARGLVHIKSDVPHQQLGDWYRAMDLFVLPSRYENFSNAMLEALACGVPSLASDVGGNRYLAESRGVWFFEPNNVQSLSTCLGHILDSRQAMQSRGALGADYVRRHYDWSASAERLKWILKSRLGLRW